MQFLSSNKFRAAVIALILANTIWGAGPPIFKWALEDIGPFTLAFFRFFLGALILFPFVASKLKVDRQDWQKLILMSLLSVTINISFYFVGLKNAPSINASIISCAAPIFIIFGSFIFLKERSTKRTIIGANIGLLGVLIVLLSPLLKSGLTLASNLSFFGNLLYLIAMFGSLGNVLIGKKLMQKYQPTTIIFWSFTIGAISFIPFFVSELAGNNFVLNLTTKSVSGILFGALLATVVAHFLFFWGLKYLNATDAGIFTYIDPIATVLIAIPLLGEIPGPFYLVGSVLVFAGIYIAEGRLHWHPLHLLRKSS